MEAILHHLYTVLEYFLNLTVFIGSGFYTGAVDVLTDGGAGKLSGKFKQFNRSFFFHAEFGA